MEVPCSFTCSYSNSYVCIIKNLAISNPETEIIEVNGKHEVGKTNLDVKGVWIDNSALKFIPRRLNEIFTNMTCLSIDTCGLKSISRDDLKGLENVEKLYFDCNKLTSLPNDLFHDMKKLTTISFYNNKLEVMSSKLLKPIKNRLDSANFSCNIKINAFFNSQISGSITLDRLMELIDIGCDAPADNFPNEDYKANVSAGFPSLWESRRFSDFTIVAGAKEFAVHKNVLGIQSSVFAAIFENDMKERNEGKMEIEEFSAAAVEEFLRCLYTGEIQDEKNAMELFALAAKYDVPDMKVIAEKMVLDNIDENNAMEVLNLGNLYGSEELKTKAFKEVQKIFPEVTLPEKLKDKPEKVTELIEGKKNFQHKIQEADEEQKRKKEAAKKEFDLMLKMYN